MRQPTRKQVEKYRKRKAEPKVRKTHGQKRPYKRKGRIDRGSEN